MVDTVKFNVGGKHFEVSRALIDARPESMLAKMISETWEQDPESPMFIDRDGDLFALVLNYLRYGSIELPVTVPQAMFQRELDYYAVSAADGSVTQEKKKTVGELMDEMAQHKKYYDLINLAVVCFNRFHQFKSTDSQQVKVGFNLTKEDGHLFDKFGGSPLSSESKRLLDKYSDHFGLIVDVDHTNIYKGFQFQVSLKN